MLLTCWQWVSVKKEINNGHSLLDFSLFVSSVQNCPTAPLNEDFFKAMSDMNLAGGSDGELDFLPLMQGMMQNLLSKDILYPALKDLKEKVMIGETLPVKTFNSHW